MQLDTPIHLYNHPENRFVAALSVQLQWILLKVPFKMKMVIVFKSDEGLCRINLETNVPEAVKNYVNQPLHFGKTGAYCH